MGQGAMLKSRQPCVDQVDDAKPFDKRSNDPETSQAFGEGFRDNFL